MSLMWPANLVTGKWIIINYVPMSKYLCNLGWAKGPLFGPTRWIWPWGRRISGRSEGASWKKAAGQQKEIQSGKSWQHEYALWPMPFYYIFRWTIGRPRRQSASTTKVMTIQNKKAWLKFLLSDMVVNIACLARTNWTSFHRTFQRITKACQHTCALLAKQSSCEYYYISLVYR